VAHRAGHALHTELGRAILADREAWCLVEAPALAPELSVLGAPAAARAH
jgi:UDP-3-O-acyl-N-acetylglucosamine deacetylase